MKIMNLFYLFLIKQVVNPKLQEMAQCGGFNRRAAGGRGGGGRFGGRGMGGHRGYGGGGRGGRGGRW
jgi:ATP-dependent RNA helicase DDX5/DBP2